MTPHGQFFRPTLHYFQSALNGFKFGMCLVHNSLNAMDQMHAKFEAIYSTLKF